MSHSTIHRACRAALPAALAGLLLVAPPAGAQAPTDVRIDISTGVGKRIRIHCESLKTPSDRNSASWGVQADEVLARDLDWSAVFTVSRSWVAGQQPVEVQAVVGGRLTVTGTEVRLQGEVLDFPARRPIMAREYRAPLKEWRTAVHQFADDVVLQFTGEPGVSQTRIAFIGQSGRNKDLYVMDYDGARLTALTNDQSIALSPSWSPEGSLVIFTSYRGGAGPRHFAFHPNNRTVYLLNELDASLHVYAYDAQSGTLSERQTALALPPDFSGPPRGMCFSRANEMQPGPPLPATRSPSPSTRGPSGPPAATVPASATAAPWRRIILLT